MRERMIEKSDEWKRGDKWRKQETGKIDDMDKGSVMRNHPHLMRPASSDEARDIRRALPDPSHALPPLS